MSLDYFIIILALCLRLFTDFYPITLYLLRLEFYFLECGKVKINRRINKYSKSFSFSEASVPNPCALSNPWTSPCRWHPPWCGLNPLLQFYYLLSQDGELYGSSYWLTCLSPNLPCVFLPPGFCMLSPLPGLIPLSPLRAQILFIKFYSSTAISFQIHPWPSHHL